VDDEVDDVPRGWTFNHQMLQLKSQVKTSLKMFNHQINDVQRSDLQPSNRLLHHPQNKRIWMMKKKNV